MADPKILREQLNLFIENPDAMQADDAQKQELLRLSRQAAAALESPFEMLQRIVYSVRNNFVAHAQSHARPSLMYHIAAAPCFSEYMSRLQCFRHAGGQPGRCRGQHGDAGYSKRAPSQRPRIAHGLMQAYKAWWLKCHEGNMSRPS